MSNFFAPKPSSPSSVTELFEAVFLFQDEQISRELLYPEFEAILDGFIPFPDFADATAKAVYLQIDHLLKVRSLVFFLISFDGQGMVDRRWNVPLRHLVDATGSGPDMGAGPIRLACLSQCPIAWHQKNLWDPVMEKGNNAFIAIRNSVKANRLGLMVKPAIEAMEKPQGHAGVDGAQQAAFEQRLHEHYAKEVQGKMSMLVKEQRLQIATLMNQHQARLHALQQEHQHRLMAYQQKLRDMEKQYLDATNRNRTLKDNLDVQAIKIEGMRDYFTHKLKAAQADEPNRLQLMQESFAFELDAKIRAATAELREMLDMREVELFYRHQNEKALKDEIVNLKREQRELLKHSGEQLLERLTKAGISLVALLPGLGETAIPVDDVGSFLADPDAYAANVTGLNEAIYLAWLEHHRFPQCNAVDPRGRRCGCTIPVIESPFEFIPGESDRCAQHQAIMYPRVAEY